MLARIVKGRWCMLVGFEQRGSTYYYYYYYYYCYNYYCYYYY